MTIEVWSNTNNHLKDYRILFSESNDLSFVFYSLFSFSYVIYLKYLIFNMPDFIGFCSLVIFKKSNLVKTWCGVSPANAVCMAQHDWWDMVTSSNGNIFRVTSHLCGNPPVTSEFPAPRPVTRSFDVFFDLRLNERLSTQSWSWWFETLSRPLWRHSNGTRRLVTDGV